MPYRLNRLPQQPIIVLTIISPYNPAREMAGIDQEMAALASDIPGRVFRVIDISEWTDMKFSDTVEVLARDSRDSLMPVSDSRYVTVVVATSEIHKLTANAANGAQYGYANQTKMFASMEEALAHIQAEIASAEK